VFLHVFKWPEEPLTLPALPAKVVNSRVLTGGKATVRQTKAGLEIFVAPADRDPADTVVVLELDKPASLLTPLAVTSVSLTKGAAATASNIFRQQTEYGPDKAVDGNDETRWACDSGTTNAWLALDLGHPVKFSRAALAEAFPERVQKFELQWLDGAEWKTFCTGKTIGEYWTRRFEPITARQVRLKILEATDGPAIWEFELFE